MMTILTSRHRRLCKTISRAANGAWTVKGYDEAATFDVDTVEDIQTVDDLYDVLRWLNNEPQKCVVRGGLVDPSNSTNVRRRYLPKAGHPDPAFCAVDRQWLCIDFDKIAVPASAQTDAERIEWLVWTLPPAFDQVSYTYQWSSSAGLNGWGAVSAHVWFLLDRPYSDADIKRRAAAQGWPCDHSLFQPVQPHFTAAPVFVGCADPLENRVGIVRKDNAKVTLPAYQPPARHEIKRRVVDFSVPADRPICHDFEDALAQVGQPSVHLSLLRASMLYYATTREPDRDYLIDRFREATAPTGRDYVDDDYLAAVVDSAAEKASYAPREFTRPAYMDAKKMMKKFKKAR